LSNDIEEEEGRRRKKEEWSRHRPGFGLVAVLKELLCSFGLASFVLVIAIESFAVFQQLLLLVLLQMRKREKEEKIRKRKRKECQTKN